MLSTNNAEFFRFGSDFRKSGCGSLLLERNGTDVQKKIGKKTKENPQNTKKGFWALHSPPCAPWAGLGSVRRDWMDVRTAETSATDAPNSCLQGDEKKTFSLGFLKTMINTSIHFIGRNAIWLRKQTIFSCPSFSCFFWGCKMRKGIIETSWVSGIGKTGGKIVNKKEGKLWRSEKFSSEIIREVFCGHLCEPKGDIDFLCGILGKY